MWKVFKSMPIEERVGMIVFSLVFLVFPAVILGLALVLPD
jgi:hypothetical protein